MAYWLSSCVFLPVGKAYQQTDPSKAYSGTLTINSASLTQADRCFSRHQVLRHRLQMILPMQEPTTMVHTSV